MKFIKIIMKNMIKKLLMVLIISVVIAMIIQLFFTLNNFYIELKEMHKSITDIYTLLHKSWLF